MAEAALAAHVPRCSIVHTAKLGSSASIAFMLKLSRNQWAVACPSFVLVLAACAAVAGVSMTATNAVLLLVACVAPTATMLLVWRGPPPPTPAELLYFANGSDKRGPR